MKPVCRKCGKGVNDIGGYLRRVNEKGISGIWECFPNCDVVLLRDDALMLAIKDNDYETITKAH